MKKIFDCDLTLERILNLISISGIIGYPLSYILYFFYKQGYYSNFKINYILPVNFINFIIISSYPLFIFIAIFAIIKITYIFLIEIKLKMNFFFIISTIINIFFVAIINYFFYGYINTQMYFQIDVIEFLSFFISISVFFFFIFMVYAFCMWFTRISDRKPISNFNIIKKPSIHFKKITSIKVKYTKRYDLKKIVLKIRNTFKYGVFPLKETITWKGKKYILHKHPYYHLSVAQNINLSTKAKIHSFILPNLLAFIFIMLMTTNFCYSLGQSSHSTRTYYLTVTYNDATYFVVDENDSHFLIMPFKNDIIINSNYQIISKENIVTTSHPSKDVIHILN